MPATRLAQPDAFRATLTGMRGRRWNAPLVGVALGLWAGVVGCDDPPSPEHSPRPPSTAPPAATPAAAPTTTADPADLKHLELLRRAAEREPESAAAQVRLAKQLVKLSRWDDAEDAVNAALAIDADGTEAQRLKRYLPKLRAAKSPGARRRLEIDMAGESLTELGNKLEGAVPRGAFEARSEARQSELRERFGIDDASLRAQRPRGARALMRLSQALEAIESLPDKEAHIRQILADHPDRIGAMVKLLDVLIEQGRYGQARRDVAVFRKKFPVDLVLRLYEHHLEALSETTSKERARTIAKTLAMERLTLLTMISNAKIGKLQQKPR